MLREVQEKKCYYLDLFGEFGTRRRESMVLNRERDIYEVNSDYGGASRTQSMAYSQGGYEEPSGDDINDLNQPQVQYFDADEDAGAPMTYRT
jgi:hypothetical protein